MRTRRWRGVRLSRVMRIPLALLGALVAGTTQAGMPAVLPLELQDRSLGESVATLSDWAMQRLDAISFFLLVILLCAGATKLVWNSLQKNFQSWPKLSYWRALALVLIWGCLFVVVLTMISGARELMTPGAWERQGMTYKLAAVNGALPPEERVDRRERLKELRDHLWRYSSTHGGKFPPPTLTESPIPAVLWQLPDLPGLRFQLVPERTANDQPALLVYEPELGQPQRLVLLTNGEITRRTSAEIAKLIHAAKPSPATPTQNNADVPRQ